MFINQISNSKYDTAKQCDLKFKLRYHDKIQGPDETNNDALVTGNYVHRIFELGYKETSADPLYEIMEQEKENYPVSPHRLDEVRQCIKNFVSFNTQPLIDHTLAVEHSFEVEIPSFTLVGKIDRVIKADDGSYLVIDYKTSNHESNKLSLKNDGQLKKYAYAISKEFKVPIEKITCAHYYPKTGNFVPTSFRSISVLNHIKEVKEEVWRIRKLKLEQVHPRKNRFCDWCEYKSLCPLYNDPLLIEERMKCAAKFSRKQKESSSQSQRLTEIEEPVPENTDDVCVDN